MRLRTSFMAHLALLAFLALSILSACGAPTIDPSMIRQDSLEAIRHVSGRFHGLSPFGTPEPGALYDPIANALQNRDIPPDRYTAVKLDDLLGQNNDALLTDANLPRDQWSHDILSRVMSVEQTGQTVSGVLSEAVVNDPEGVNSFSKDYRTIHLLLTRAQGESKIGAMEVDLNPRLIERHPTWNSVLNKVGAQVRVSGWPYFDARHKGWLADARRGTLWRIAPVTKLEILDSLGHWQEL